MATHALPEVAEILALQDRLTDEWHQRPVAPEADGWQAVVSANHSWNFQLWHEEDKARRDDKGDTWVRDAKRAIDGHNQRRNDAMEAIDAHWLERIRVVDTAPPHTETPGMIIDRLSILSLKRFHTEETRQELGAERDAELGERLARLDLQRQDLAEAFTLLMTELREGRKRFRIYRQLKLYNDPTLNPELRRQAGK